MGVILFAVPFFGCLSMIGILVWVNRRLRFVDSSFEARRITVSATVITVMVVDLFASSYLGPVVGAVLAVAVGVLVGTMTGVRSWLRLRAFVHTNETDT